MCRYTDLNLNKTKYHVQGLVTLWIINRHYKFKVRYPEHGYHVNFPALFKPYVTQRGHSVYLHTHRDLKKSAACRVKPFELMETQKITKHKALKNIQNKTLEKSC